MGKKAITKINNKNIFLRLIACLLQSKKELIIIFGGAIISVPLIMAGPIFIGRAVDSAVSKGEVDFNALLFNLAALGITVIIAAFFQWVLQVAATNISAKAVRRIRNEAFAQINSTPFKKLDKVARGDIVSRLVNDADAVAEGIAQGLAKLFPGCVTIIATLVLMTMLDYLVTLAVVVITPVSVLFGKFVVRRTGKLFIRQSDTLGRMSSFISQAINGHTLINDFAAHENFEKGFLEVSADYHRSSFKATLYSSIINPGTRFINALMYAAVAMLGGFLAVSGGITIGGVSALLAYANQYTKPFNEISAVITQIQSAMSGASRLFEVIDWPSEQPDRSDCLSLDNVRGAVVLENVNFSYNLEKPLIKNFNIDVKPGQRVALVGHTGCGKTTIINLLMRFYEADSGVIKVDGIPIQNIARDNLRGHFGMVLQDCWLKQGTILENIAYGRRGAQPHEIIAAAKAGYAHEFISRLPYGYDTMVKAGGENLSAGQRQLICISRIMLAKPDILILDEATSNIDTRTEMLIQKALERLMEGRTCLIVAHRLQTIKNADMILVMGDGKIMERGCHDQLLSQNGHYTSLYNSMDASS